MDRNKTLNLLKKLNELAKRGVDGEKDNAMSKLLDLLDKHGLKLEDIESEKVEGFIYKVSGDEEIKFFTQICFNVMGNKTKVWSFKGTKKKVEVECTEAEFIEIVSRHEFFYQIYQKEKSIFYSAFIQSNKLYKLVEEGDEDEPDNRTQEQKERDMKVAMLAINMDRHTHYKRIED